MKEKAVTLDDIAKRLNLSTVTVSNLPLVFPEESKKLMEEVPPEPAVVPPTWRLREPDFDSTVELVAESYRYKED